MGYTKTIWLEDLSGCHRERRQKQFAIGDAVNRAFDSWNNGWNKQWGFKTHSDLWRQASEATGTPVDSLFQYSRVARVFPSSQRTYDISFGAYQILAGVEDESTRRSLAQRASDTGLTCDVLRGLIRELKQRAGLKTKRRGERKALLSISVGVDVYSLLRRKAKQKNLTVAGLLRQFAGKGK